MNIADHMRRQCKYAGEDVSMYWNATRFLWRVFTHPRNPDATRRIPAAGDYVPATAYRARARATSRAAPQRV